MSPIPETAEEHSSVNQIFKGKKGKNQNWGYQAVYMNNAHAAGEPAEQERLKKEFPDDPNIVVKKKSGACYVKGRLMPTRSFGDFHLKYQSLCNPNNMKREYG